MSSEDYEIFRQLRLARKALRAIHAMKCPRCLELLPKANASLLLPQERCKIHGYVDPRPRVPNAEVDAIFLKFGITRTRT